MAIEQYTAKHRKWDHVGNLTPNIEVSESVRTGNEYIPAPWLPVQRFDKHFEDYYVVSAGKAVGFTRDSNGFVVPAGLALAWAAAGSGGTTVFSYSDRDLEERVMDIRTGQALAVGYTAAVTRDQIETAILGTTAGPSATNNPFSPPAGIAPYNYIKHPGGDRLQNPADLEFHNYRPQATVAILHDRHIELPLVPAQTATESLTTSAQWTSAGGDVYYRPFTNQPIAKPTRFLPYVFSNTTVFKLEQDLQGDLQANGDYFVDTTTGRLYLFNDTIDPTASAATLGTVTYYNYASAPASVGTFAACVGNLRPGDYLKCDANSNLAKWIKGTDAPEEILAQVLAFQYFPRGGLDKVRTAFDLGRLHNAFPWPSSGPGDFDKDGKRDAMPGSASEGLPANVTYAGAANISVRINLMK